MQRDLLQHERLSNLGKMSNMILHDIRNPVAVLKGYAQMLTSVAGDPVRVQEFARRIATEAERLGHLSGELLDYARGEVRLDMSVIAPSVLVEEARSYLDGQIRGTPIACEISVRNDEPLVADYARMVRVLINLLDNARKACRTGGTIRITVERRENMAAIAVADSGEGMSEEVSARIFEPFFSRSSGGGTGLGMVIARNIVDAHGGTLEVTSREGSGTTVTILLPTALPGQGDSDTD